MKPPASQYAIAMSHGISLANALNASANVSVLVSIDTPRPSTATAPSGSGVVMMPTIVPVKMASRFHALAVTPAGAGASASATPTPIEIARFFMSAPLCFGRGVCKVVVMAMSGVNDGSKKGGGGQCSVSMRAAPQTLPQRRHARAHRARAQRVSSEIESMAALGLDLPLRPRQTVIYHI